MPADLTAHVVHTGANGTLSGMTAADVVALVDAAANSPRIVLHFHGGLNTRAMGEASAQRWLPVYQEAGAYPIFFVWESGLLETISHNLDGIFRDPIFGKSMRLLLRYTVGLLRSAAGARGTALDMPSDLDVGDELNRRQYDEEPFAEVDTDRPDLVVDVEHVTRIEQSVERDAELTGAVRAAVADRAADTAGIRGTKTVVEFAPTLLDPGVLDEIASSQVAGGKAVFTTIAFARIIGRILVRVIARFRAGTDSGVYPTVVEEVLRGLYLANAGGAVWRAMKNETAETFVKDGSPRGGRTVLDELVRTLADRRDVEITLVGHSTGAVFINNLLGSLASAQAAGEPGWTASVSLRIVLLAPAATLTHVAGVLSSLTDSVDHIRVFTMADAAERADHLLGGAYPRSLLYLVANVLERDPAGESAVTPLIGLQRWLIVHAGATDDGVPVRAYLSEQHRVVLCPTPDDAPLGQRSAACSHTGFNNDPGTMASVGALIADPAAWAD